MQFYMVWPGFRVIMVKLNACSERHTRPDGDKYIDLGKILPLLYRSLTRERLAVLSELVVRDRRKEIVDPAGANRGALRGDGGLHRGEVRHGR